MSPAHSRGRLFACVLLAGVATSFPTVSAEAANAGADAAVTARLAPRLKVSNPVHDFGTVTRGSTQTHEFELSNTGTADLEIKGVEPTCGCTTADDWPKVLKPGESGRIALTLQTAQFNGPIRKEIGVTTNDPESLYATLELKANIWAPITLSAPMLVLPAVKTPTTAGSRKATIRYHQPARLTLQGVKSENPHFSPSLREVVPGREFELTVTTVPPLPEGTQTGRITMTTSDPDMPELTIQALATVLPAVQIAPTTFTFTSATLKEPEKRFAVLINHRGYDLEVSDLAIDAPGVKLSTQRAADNGQITVTLEFPAGFEPARARRLSLRGTTNHPGVPKFEIPIVYVGTH